MPSTSTVILCDESGKPLGKADILDAHTGEGKLHKAFSVFIIHADKPSMLIQQRSAKKMLFPLVWANACCSHPFEHERAVDAGRRRLQDELGFTCDLEEKESFVYRAPDPNGKGIEHEYDTILLGTIDDSVVIRPNPEEVADWKWVPVPELLEDMETHEEQYAPWFHIGIKKVLRGLPASYLIRLRN